MLNLTKAELEFVPDPGMYLFFEKSMRGGVLHILNRCSKAKNKYLKYYDLKQESKHIIYLNANNFHVYGISKFHLTSRFKWIDPKECDMDKYTSNSSKGCVLEVDLEYPQELCELHNDYLLAPHKIGMLSKYQLMIADHYHIPVGNVRKLVPIF